MADEQQRSRHPPTSLESSNARAPGDATTKDAGQ